MNGELERSSHTEIEALPRYFCEGPEENHENIEDDQYPGRESNRAPPGCKSRAFFLFGGVGLNPH
jgi:hypothetical protein